MIPYIYSKPSVCVWIGARNGRKWQPSFNNRSGVHALPPVCQLLSACPPCEAGRSFSLVVVLVSSLCAAPSAVLTCTRAAHARAILRHTHTKLIESRGVDIDWKTSSNLYPASSSEAPVTQRSESGSCCCNIHRKRPCFMLLPSKDASRKPVNRGVTHWEKPAHFRRSPNPPGWTQVPSPGRLHACCWIKQPIFTVSLSHCLQGPGCRANYRN